MESRTTTTTTAATAASGSTNSSFSSLTLFECTIGNATMLVDSMSNKDLLSAWRISGQLQNKIVEVLDPRMAELSELAEQHSRCQPPVRQEVPSIASFQRSLSDLEASYDGASAPKVARLNSVTDKHGGAAGSGSASLGGLWRHEQQLSGGGYSSGDQHNSSGSLLSVKKEECGEADLEEDCVVLEEMTECSAAAAAAAAFSSNCYPNTAAASFLSAAVAATTHLDPMASAAQFGNAGAVFGRARAGGQQTSNSAPAGAMLLVQPQVGAAGGHDSSVISGDSRNVMRLAYKQLKADGPHLFDFSKPFSAAVNQAVAARVAQHARQLPQCRNWDEATWHSPDFRPARLFQKMNYEVNHQGIRKRSTTLCFLKLSRRQRAFESLMQASEMNSEVMDRYRTILSREFTSSDEEVDEVPEGLRDEESAASAEDTQLLRVRRLAWESEEVSQLKTTLDNIYKSRFASEKQRVALTRTLRDGQVVSRRTKPANAPLWSSK